MLPPPAAAGVPSAERGLDVNEKRKGQMEKTATASQTSVSEQAPISAQNHKFIPHYVNYHHTRTQGREIGLFARTK